MLPFGGNLGEKNDTTGIDDFASPWEISVLDIKVVFGNRPKLGFVLSAVILTTN